MNWKHKILSEMLAAIGACALLMLAVSRSAAIYPIPV